MPDFFSKTCLDLTRHTMYQIKYVLSVFSRLMTRRFKSSWTTWTNSRARLHGFTARWRRGRSKTSSNTWTGRSSPLRRTNARGLGYCTKQSPTVTNTLSSKIVFEIVTWSKIRCNHRGSSFFWRFSHCRFNLQGPSGINHNFYLEF